MISQAMESVSPPQFVQTDDFPPKCFAVDNIIEVECSSEVSPFYSVQDLHCELLDIAEIVTVADCVSATDSLDTACGLISITEIVPESEACSDICLNGKDLSVKEIACEANVIRSEEDTPRGEVTDRGILPVAAKDPCECLPATRSSSDTCYASYLVTDSDSNDAESCCNTSSEITAAGVLQRSDYSKTDYFPLEVAHIMEVTTSVGDVSECCGGAAEAVQACEGSGSLLIVARPDPVVLPNLCFEPPKMEAKANVSDEFPTRHASACDSWAGHKVVTPPTNDVSVQDPSVLESREAGARSEVGNDLDADCELDVVIADDCAVPEPREGRLKLNEGADDCSCNVGLGNECGVDASAQPLLLDPYEMKIVPKEESNVSFRIADTRSNLATEHVLNALVTEGSFSLTSTVKLHKIEIKTKETRRNLSPGLGMMGNFNTNDKLLCSVMQSYHANRDEPDIELTKHLIQGLSFFTPVRDFIKSHRLLSPNNINYADISENSRFSGVDCFGNVERCCGGTTTNNEEVDLLEKQCGHYSVGAAYAIQEVGNVAFSVKKKCLRFGDITVYYFARAQGFTAISSDGGVALGMELQHCDVRLHSLLEYTMQKDQPYHNSSHRKRKKKRMSSADYESHRAIQILPSHKRASLLRAAGIHSVDHRAIQEAEMINASRLVCGCCCTDGCRPEVCSCAGLEIECLIDREGFPCKCSDESCKNPHGRSKFNPNKVHAHFVETVARMVKGGMSTWNSQETTTTWTSNCCTEQEPYSHEKLLVAYPRITS